MSKAALEMMAREYSDGERYYNIDWKKLKPEECLLDYNSYESEQGKYAEVYDTCTGTLICRTKYYSKEEYAFNAAERVIDFLKDEYDFEKNYKE
jgi:hypothetical protein